MAQVAVFSPQATLHTLSPHAHVIPQSALQVNWDSPHSGWQKPFPHRQPPQSVGQEFEVSKQFGSHLPSPQKAPGGHAPQSCGQLFWLSPQPG